MPCTSPNNLPEIGLIPCGKCHDCKMRRINQWVLRLSEERKLTKNSFFITLTYEDEYNNKSSDTARVTKNGRRTLVQRDFQLYIKRVRKFSNKHGRVRVKYYAVGEYGAKSSRPHYHAIIFGAEEMVLRTNWVHGYIHVGTVTTRSIAYCLKYIDKGRVVPIDDNDDRQKEFSLFSKGLGLNYLTPAIIAWHRADPINRCCVIREGGFKFPLPRYFRDKIFTSEQKRQIEIYFQTKYQDELRELFNNQQSPGDYQAWKKQQEDTARHSFVMMDYLSTQKNKL